MACKGMVRDSEASAAAVNTGNGPGIALYTIDLGAAFSIDSVNVFTSGPEADSNRINQSLEIFGHDSALDFSGVADVQASGVTVADNSTPVTSLGAFNDENAGGGVLFGGSSTSAGDQTFQFITVAANPNGTAGGGESSLFTEIDVIETVPEPSSALLLGLAGLGFLGRRRR